jgi:hypothetical protein
MNKNQNNAAERELNKIILNRMNFRNGNLLFVFKTLTHKQVISLPLYKSNRSFVREREPKNTNGRKNDEKKLNEKEFVISNLS